MPHYEAVPTALPALRRYLASYARIFGDGELSKTIPPRPGAVLVVTVAGDYRVGGEEVPRAAVFGIQEAPLQLRADPAPTDRMQVAFHAGGLGRFTKAPATVYTGRIVAAETVFPAEDVRRLVAALAARNDLEGRAHVLDRFFAGRIVPPTTADLSILEAARRLCDDPDATLGSVLGDLPGSLRQIERRFARLLGMSPRRFARVARFEQARRGLLERRDKRLVEVAYEAGYYDQAHFGREFRRLAGMAPGAYTVCAPPGALARHPPGSSSSDV